MPTAPSFSNYKIINPNPFIKNNKAYVTVRHPSTGKLRDVRWYSDKEFTKIYQTHTLLNTPPEVLKHARGFDNGPIIVIRNIKNDADTIWLEHSNARYATDIGWYIVSTETVPKDAPPHFLFLLLPWPVFSKHLGDSKALSKYIHTSAEKYLQN